jgi:hypothetical protein
LDASLIPLGITVPKPLTVWRIGRWALPGLSAEAEFIGTTIAAVGAAEQKGHSELPLEKRKSQNSNPKDQIQKLKSQASNPKSQDLKPRAKTPKDQGDDQLF